MTTDTVTQKQAQTADVIADLTREAQETLDSIKSMRDASQQPKYPTLPLWVGVIGGLVGGVIMGAALWL